MAPSAATMQSLSTNKLKRPTPTHIQTNGMNSSTSSPSPSISAGRISGVAKYPPNSATGNGNMSSSSAARSANRSRRDQPSQLLGRGQRNNSAGLRSASIVGDVSALPVSEPQPYIITKDYILRKYRGNPPSLIIHLYAGTFRFDKQESSFSYTSPMSILVEHLKLGTIPHDLCEFFTVQGVPFYEGCMIVQVHDHKTTTPTQATSGTTSGAAKTVPFSVHNSNAYLTPSSYVPFPKENQILKSRALNGDLDDSGKTKTAEQRDKENMPAPAFPVDGQRDKPSMASKKPRVFTTVLHPTALSKHADINIFAADPRPNGQDSRQDVNTAGPLSATVPPTPSSIIPPQTPFTSMAPPAKRLKKAKVESDSNNLVAAESQIALSTTAPLMLEPVKSAAECNALLQVLAHPMHSELPPSPKSRKRTVAEMEADEAHAAEREKYMLICDDRLSSSAAAAQGAANAVDGDGQAGGAPFEPRFERFKLLENIKNNHEETKKAEAARQVEVERKTAQERERDKLRHETEKREHEKLRQQNLARQQEASRRAQANQGAQQMNAQLLQGGAVQGQVQHAHPQGQMNNMMNIQAPAQRFHQQQVSQVQASSPINHGTPINHSSPSMNNIGSAAMQNSASSIGGSPARPGSVVNQNHPQVGPTAQAMTANRSQQSHAGTPRMPMATPNMHPASLNRPMSQTPRMSQASPPAGQVSMQMLPNGQMPGGVTPQHQQAILQQQQFMRQQNILRQNGMAGGPMAHGQQMSPQQQQQLMMMRAAQQGQNKQNPGMMAPNYQQQIAAMQQRQQAQQAQQAQAGMHGFNGQAAPNNMPQNMQQIQAMQQMQQQMQQQHIQQAQMHAAQQVQAQQAQGGRMPMNQPQMNGQPRNPQQVMQMQVMQRANQLLQQQIPLLAANFGGNIPEEAMKSLKIQCQTLAHTQVMEVRRRQMAANNMQQQQQQQQQNNMGLPGQQM